MCDGARSRYADPFIVPTDEAEEVQPGHPMHRGALHGIPVEFIQAHNGQGTCTESPEVLSGETPFLSPGDAAQDEVASKRWEAVSLGKTDDLSC